LRLFREGDDYFSVLTLAGAAEEILGKLLRSSGRQNSLDDLTSGAVLVYKHLFGEEAGAKEFAIRANRARNASKHLDAGGPTITLDIRDEAKDMLIRAIDNYWLLEESLTPAMRLFTQEQRVA
jgi:hypothetical protein